MVTLKPGSARTQVSGYFLHLGKSIVQTAGSCFMDRSRELRFGQVRRLKNCEPCSRRWSAGSIAAFKPVVGSSLGIIVLPPLVGGLHCGIIRRYGAHVPHCGAPAAGRRAPLRPHGKTDSPPARRSAPPLVGGLHCGEISPEGPVFPSDVLPPLVGGLHCGTRCTVIPALVGPVLPPLVGGLHCGRRPRPVGRVGDQCSRRWSAGSIAAVEHVPDLSAGKCAPAAGRRAPSR